MKRISLSGAYRLAVGMALLWAGATATAQTDVLYVTDGDSSRLAIVQDGVLQDITTTYVRGYPIAVRDTIWIGDYNGNSADAFEYDLAGVGTGNRAPYSAVRAVDGGVNGDVNYQLGNAFSSSATVYVSDADWQNETALFSVSGSDLVGITFDPVNGSIWISDDNTVYEYDTTGNLLGKFGHSSGRGCIAYELSSDTIWYVTNGSDRITQYSKTGAVLTTLSVSGLNSNNWGAEFASEPAAPCLELRVDRLVSGAKAGWHVSGATAGEQVAVVYSFRRGSTILNGYAGYCVSFGLRRINQMRVVCLMTADGAGNATCTKEVPAGAQGQRILSQAAERNTCPKECLSGIDAQIIG